MDISNGDLDIKNPLVSVDFHQNIHWHVLKKVISREKQRVWNQYYYSVGNSVCWERILISDFHWFVGFCGLLILGKEGTIFLYKGWCLQRFRHFQLKSSSTNIDSKISGEWCRRWKDRWVKEEQEEIHQIYFFLLNSMRFHSLLHNITLNSSLTLLKLSVTLAKVAQ